MHVSTFSRQLLRAALTLSLVLTGCGGDDDATFTDGGPVIDPTKTPDGGTTTGDGTVLYPDGSVVYPDGGVNQTCPNGQIDQGEDCDGQNLNNQNCQTQGFTGGQLRCTTQCKYDTSACTNDPNQKRKFGELCAGGYGECEQGLHCIGFSLGGNENYGYCTAECVPDQVACPSSPPNAACGLEISQGVYGCAFLCSETNPACPAGMACHFIPDPGVHVCTTDPAAQCNNDKLEGNEQCDTNQMNNANCQTFGFTGGQLKCNSSCQFDMSACTGTGCTSLPEHNCTAGNAACTALELFPRQGDGYLTYYPEAYTWLRHDTTMLVQYASAAVKCLMPGSWPLAFGDMSMQNGATPTNRHPDGTHDGGLNVDIAYYQTGTPNNYLREVCPHTINGQEAHHCTAPPTILDAPRTALFIAKLLESSRIRVMGVDGQIGPVLQNQAQQLLQQGIISNTIYQRFGYMTFEQTNEGRGWYYSHHHHIHLSTNYTQYSTPMQPEPAIEPAPEALPSIDELPRIVPLPLSIVPPENCLQGDCRVDNPPLLDLDALSRQPDRATERFPVRRLSPKSSAPARRDGDDLQPR